MPLSATCTTSGQRFTLTGCYPDNDNATEAPGFVAGSNVGHWDSYYGITLDDDGNVTQWVSREDKNGRSHVLTTTGTDLSLMKIIHWLVTVRQFLGAVVLVTSKMIPTMD